MFGFTYHLEITLEADDYDDEKFYNAVSEYETAFPYYQKRLVEEETKCPVCHQKISKSKPFHSAFFDGKEIQIHKGCKNKPILFVTKRPEHVPEYIIGCHGVQNGICFNFDSKENLEYGVKNILKEPFFVQFVERHPLFNFRVGMENAWGMNAANLVVRPDANNNFVPDQEWNAVFGKIENSSNSSNSNVTLTLL